MGETTRSAEDGLRVRFSLEFGPFFFDSELDLRELHGAVGSARLPVTLRLGGVPARLPGGVPMGPQREFTRREFLLTVPGTGRFYVRNGDEVRVEPEENCDTSDLSIYLLGSVFGALCHQNGLLPLHASAVEAGGTVTAFLGDSGSGKSSMVALLGQRGYRVFADDICLLEPVGEGLAAAPLANWLKLWRETFEHIGEEPEAANRTFSADDKYRKYLGGQDTTPLPVRQFCFLTRIADGEARLETLGTAEAISLLLATVYPGYPPEVPAEELRLFRQCAIALAGARAYRLVMPWGWDRVAETLDLVEGKLLNI